MMIERKFVKQLSKRLNEALIFIQVVLGPRQVGKTTGVKQLLSKWDGPSIFVSADDVEKPTAEWIEFHWQRAREKGVGTLLVIDEIQKVKDWSRIVKKLFDEDRMKKTLKVVLLGSASLTIQKGLTESLAGRYEKAYVGHWSFKECKEAFGWTLRQYVLFGGYPAAASLVSDIQRWRKFIKDAIIDPVIGKDLLSLGVVHKPALFKQCFELSMCYPAQEISLQKLLGQLQENGNISTIKHYLTLFEGAFLLKTLQKYTGSEIKTRHSSPKILPLNTALVQGLRSGGSGIDDPEWYGRLFEAAVGAKLSEFEGELFYWRQGEYEVDFILKNQEKVIAIEVKSMRRAHLKGLQQFKKQHPHCQTVIIDTANAESFFLMESSQDLLHL